MFLGIDTRAGRLIAEDITCNTLTVNGESGTGGVVIGGGGGGGGGGGVFTLSENNTIKSLDSGSTTAADSILAGKDTRALGDEALAVGKDAIAYSNGVSVGVGSGSGARENSVAVGHDSGISPTQGPFPFSQMITTQFDSVLVLSMSEADANSAALRVGDTIQVSNFPDIVVAGVTSGSVNGTRTVSSVSLVGDSHVISIQTIAYPLSSAVASVSGAEFTPLRGRAVTSVGSESAGKAGDNLVALGHKAAEDADYHRNCTVINATGEALNPTQDEALYVKPVRDAIGTDILMYDDTSGEITRTDPFFFVDSENNHYSKGAAVSTIYSNCINIGNGGAVDGHRGILIGGISSVALQNGITIGHETLSLQTNSICINATGAQRQYNRENALFIEPIREADTGTMDLRYDTTTGEITYRTPQIAFMTQATYDAQPVKNPNILYVIT